MCRFSENVQIWEILQVGDRIVSNRMTFIKMCKHDALRLTENFKMMPTRHSDASWLFQKYLFKKWSKCADFPKMCRFFGKSAHLMFFEQIFWNRQETSEWHVGSTKKFSVRRRASRLHIFMNVIMFETIRSPTWRISQICTFAEKSAHFWEICTF